jgi:pimeloyl-ACP methyl ester carboxylesterase
VRSLISSAVVSKREHIHIAADGTRLYARDEGPLQSTLLPLLCLPGLTRHSGDFDPVFKRYAKSRRVIAMDFRGRGGSAQASDPATYRPDVEMADTIEFLDALNVPRVAVLGTSRGGIVGLLMGTMAATHIEGLMLNDVGCKLEQAGLLRIRNLVAAQPVFRTWDKAATVYARNARGFSRIAKAKWITVVRRIYFETEAGIIPKHDPALASTLPSDAQIKAGQVAELWSLLPPFAGTPLALLRGEGSDLLSQATVEQMRQASPHLVATTIPHRGHVPFLDEPKSKTAIDAWLAEVDARG